MALLIIIPGYSFCQSYSLKDIAKQIIKAENNYDTTQLDKVTLNYDEYETLFDQYLNSASNGGDRKETRASKRSKKDFDILIRAIHRLFYYDFFNFGYEQTIKYNRVTYLNYAYEINTDEQHFGKTALLRIYVQRDSTKLSLGNFHCYKTGKGWKLAGMDQKYIRRVDFADPNYQEWSKSFEPYTNQSFSYKTPENIWKQIIAGPSSLDREIILTEDEFKKTFIRYNFYYAERPNDSVYKFIDLYTSYLNEAKRFFNNMHDSVMKYPCISREFDKSTVVGSAITNDYRFEHHAYNWGKGFRQNFHFSLNCISSGKTEKYLLGNFFYLIPIIGNKWKLMFAFPYFLKDEGYSNWYQLAPMTDFSYNSSYLQD